MKIYFKLTIVLGIVVTVTVLVIGATGYRAGSSVILSDVSKYQLRGANNLINSIDQIMHSYQEDIIKLATNPVLESRQSNKEDYLREFIKYREQSEGYLSLAFYNIDKKPVAVLDERLLIKETDVEHVWGDIQFGKFNVGNYIRYEQTLKIPLAFFAVPMHDPSGKPKGMLMVVSNLKGIQSLINDFSTVEGEFATLIDSQKNVIFSSDPEFKEELSTTKIEDLKSVREVLSGREGTMIEYFKGHNESEVVTYVKEKGLDDFTGNNWYLLVMADEDELLLPIESLKNRLISFGIIFVVVSIVLGYVLSRTMTGSLQKILRVIEMISRGDLKQRIKSNAKDEIGHLASTIDQMLDNINSYQEQLEVSKESLETKNKTLEEQSLKMEDQLEELRKFQQVTIDREIKMIELKKALQEAQNELRKHEGKSKKRNKL